MRLLVACLIAGVFAAPGCRTPHRVQMGESGTPQYGAANVVYDLTGQMQTAFIRPHEPKIRPVSFEESEASVEAGESSEAASELPKDWTHATLQIQYPHPSGRTDAARATLRLSRQPVCAAPDANLQPTDAKRNESTEDELWTLDLPKYQLDLLLFDLANSGYFDGQMRPSGGAQLTVGVDQGETSKPWCSEPRLNDLLLRVYEEGKLEGFAKPPAAQLAQAKQAESQSAEPRLLDTNADADQVN